MKYALVHNNQIKVGPRDYHYGFFFQYLKDNNLDTNIPLQYSDITPIGIQPDVVILPVEEPSIPSHNALTEQLAGPFLTITPTIVNAVYTVADKPLDAAKNELKAKVADVRYNKEVGGTKVTLQGQEVSIDTCRGEDRDIWFQAFMLLPEDSVQKFKFPKENIWLDLNKAEIGSIVQTIMAHVQSAFEWEAVKVAEIDAALDKVAVEAIVVEDKQNGS